MKSSKLFILRLAEFILLPISLFAFGIYLPFKCFRSFRRADVIVLPEKMNFGTTAYLPDLARRIYPGKHVVFMVFRELSHNSILPEIWREVENIDFLSLSRCGISRVLFGRNVSLPNRKVFDPLAVMMVEWLALRIGGSPLIIRDRLDLYDHVDIPEPVQEALANSLAHSPDDPEIGMWAEEMPYFSLFYFRNEAHMADPGLPRRHCDKVEKALLRSRGDREGIRLCGLYIKKIRNSVAPLSEDFLQRWEGSDFKAYLPSVRFLVERGFQVLLTGDTDIPEDVAEEFGGMFVNGDAIGIDSDLFKIYAALHTDIFIGDCGGGWSLAGLSAERPMLGLNVFSFFCSDGKFWLYYKHAFDGRGNHVPFRDMARKYAFNKNFPETYTAVKNSADEILEAVRCYVDEMEHPGSSKVDSSLEDLWPVYSEFKISGSHISPAFVENYNKKRALADVA